MHHNHFGTDGIRGRVGELPITADYVERLGLAFGHMLCERTGLVHPRLVLGRDTRESGPMLEAALTTGLLRAGVSVMRLGVVPSPAVAHLAARYGAQAGAVISASHNPACDNGIKFFDAQGRKLSDEDQARVVQLLTQPRSAVEDIGRLDTAPRAVSDYVDFLLGTEPGVSLAGQTLVVDAAHGAASACAREVFERLGARVHLMGAEPDGLNINDGVGALHPEGLARAVLQTGAHAGVALDGDADRLVMVDARGQVLDGDAILYVLTRDRLVRGPVPGVAGTVTSNAGLEHALARLGVAFVRTKVGDCHVAQALDERGWTLGAETSGHVLDFSKLTTGDGLLAALGVLAAMTRAGSSLQVLTEGLELYPQHKVNVTLERDAPRGAFWERDAGFKAALSRAEDVLRGCGRVLVRASGTEPLVRVMVEARDAELAREQAEQLAQALCRAARPETNAA